jgi:hypothetical protein
MEYSFDIEGAKKQTAIERKKRAIQLSIDKLYFENEGLEEAMKSNHTIIKKMAENLRLYGNMSEKQVALAIKLASERQAYESVAVATPTGKIEGIFKVLSSKPYCDNYGRDCFKVLLQHSTDSWKCYGNYAVNLEIGVSIDCKMEVTPSNTDQYFGFFKRLKIKN